MDAFVHAGAWSLAVVCALLAGVYGAFSTFLMKALERVTPSAGIQVMQEINAVIVRSPFIVLFFGSTVAALVFVVAGLHEAEELRGLAFTAAGVVHVIGMFGVTVLVNVPLNNALSSLDPNRAGDAQIWRDYIRRWTAWNHVRTAACLLASVLLGIAAA